MVPETLDQILKQENLQAFMEPELEILEIEPVSFKAVVPLEPVVELGDLSSISVTRQPVEITDEQVSDVIEQLRYESGPWEPVDRPVQFGDLLSLNVTGTIGESSHQRPGYRFYSSVGQSPPNPGILRLPGRDAGGPRQRVTLTIPRTITKPNTRAMSVICRWRSSQLKRRHCLNWMTNLLRASEMATTL